MYSFLVAVSTLLVGTACSPIFPYQVWNDANCFFTVGRQVLKGTVLYRDIFEQKGLYLYFIYGIANLFSKTSFFGVYILECIAFSVTLYFVAKISSYFLREKYIYWVVLAFAVLTVLSSSFEKGGSAEEFCLPVFMIFLCHGLEYLCGLGTGIRKSKFLADGILLAVVFWIKYNLVFLCAGVILGTALSFWFGKKKKELRQYLMFGFAGMLIGTVPLAAYFTYYGAWGDLWFGYFYSNLFLYHESGIWYEKLRKIIEFFLDYFKKNSIIAVMVILGLVRFSYRVRKTWKKRTLFLSWGMVMFLIGSILIPQTVYAYYPLPAVVFLVFGLIELARCPFMALAGRVKPWAIGVATAVCVVLVLYGSNVYFLLPFSKEDIPQQQFAEIIQKEKDATVLNYACLDTGIYTLAGIDPPSRFFCRLNLKGYDEMFREQDAIVAQQKVDFIVTVTTSSYPEYYEGYREVSCLFMQENGPNHFHLLKKIKK